MHENDCFSNDYVSNEEIIEKLRNWVLDNYEPELCAYTARRSEGNYYDCFQDGCDSQLSWDAYEIGRILGMELNPPEMPEDDDEW